MSEAQHTPGPWRAIKFDECQTSIVADLEPKRHPLVAIVSVGEGRPDGEANVALILSAPALLAENRRLRWALERIATEHCAYKTDCNSQYDIGVVDGHRCAATIAKAALTPAGGGQE